jgi:hypothetical protein
VQPESPDNNVASVSSCVGIALGLLDDALTRADAPNVALPAGRWNGERAATDILALARKGKAFRSLDRLLVRRGGPQVLNGSVLALAATVSAIAPTTNTPTADTVQTLIR